MGFKTTSTRFTQAKSAQSSDLVAYNNATSGGPSITGTSLTANSVITTVTVTPGANASSTTATTSGGGVLISNIVYTNSAYATLSANAAATTYGAFRILGTGFVSGANVFLSNTSAGTISNITSNTTFISSGEIRANANVTAGNYSLLVTNPSGGAAIYYSGVSFEPYPLWNTSSLSFNGTSISGNVATYVTSTAIEQPITFALASGNTLPTGLTLYSNGAILGTVTQSNLIQTYYANISATDLYNETTTANVSITISLADPSFNYTTLLLNGETNTNTYIQDASTNNFGLTVSGSATPNRFSPLWGAGYYANSFDGSTGYMTVSASTLFNFGTGNFTIEAWIYTTSSSTQRVVSYATGSSLPYEFLLVNTGSSLYLNFFDGTNNNSTGSNYVPQNQWVHIAVSRSGTSMYLFINGVLSGTTTNSINLTSTGSLYIGTYKPSPTNYFTGYISNLRIVNGTAVYTSAFTPSTTPLTAIANTVLLTCQSPYFIDNSTNAFTITPSGTVKVVPNQPFGALPSGVQTYGSGLFDGSTGYITTPTAGNSAFVFGTGDFSMELWVYAASYASSYISVLNVGPASGGYIVYIETSGNQARFLDYNNPSASFVFTGGTLTNNTWNHLVLTRQSSTVRGFVNGQLVGYASSITTNYNVSASYASIGATSGLAGNISNIRIVKGGIPTAYATSSTTNNAQIFTPPTSPFTGSESLTGGSVSLLTLQYKNGVNNNVFYDDGQNNYALTRNGTVLQGTFSPFSQTGWSNYFGSAATSLQAPSGASVSGTGNFTVEFWINPVSFGSSYQVVLANDTSGGFSCLLNYTGTFSFGISLVNVTGTTSNTLTFNTWNHVAIVRNSGTVNMYINGVSGYSATNSTNYTAGIVRIGTDGGGSNFPFNGYLSSVRITNTAVYTTNFTPSTTPLTAISGTSLLTCQSNRFIDTSTNAFTLTPSGAAQVQSFSPFAPGVSYSAANNGGSMYFNGTTPGAIAAPNSVSYFSTGNWTMECWAWFNSNSSGYQPIMGQAGTADYQGPIIVIETNNTFAAYIVGTGSAWTYYINQSSVPVINCWTHIALVRNGSTVTYYINGAVIGSTSISGSINATTGGNFFVGYYPFFPGGARTFSGYISGARAVGGTAIYTSAFTPPTAPPTPVSGTNLLISGTNTGLQDQTSKNMITYSGNQILESSTVKYGSGAMYFDGSSYVIVPYNNLWSLGSGNFTIEFWIKTNNSTQYATLISNTPSTFATSDWSLLMNNASSSAGDIAFYVADYSTATPLLSTSGSLINDNNWHHVAVVRNGSTWTCYVNGTSQATGTSSATIASSTNPVHIGHDPYYTRTFTGYMDDFRVTKGIARYTTNFTPPAIAFLTQ